MLIDIHEDGSVTFKPQDGGQEFLLAGLVKVVVVGGAIEAKPITGKQLRYDFREAKMIEDNGDVRRMLEMLDD